MMLGESRQLKIGWEKSAIEILKFFAQYLYKSIVQQNLLKILSIHFFLLFLYLLSLLSFRISHIQYTFWRLTIKQNPIN